MNEKVKRVAEDILSGETISDDTIKTLEIQGAGRNKKNIKQADQIYNYLKSPKFLFSPVEKERLKSKIEESVEKLNKRRRIQR